MSDFPAICRNPTPFPMLADDQPIPGRDDLADFVQPGESEIDPNDFINRFAVYGNAGPPGLFEQPEQLFL